MQLPYHKIMDKLAKEEILTAVGDNIRLERLRRKLTQEKLAELSGITQKYLNYIEKAKVNPSITVVICICKSLNVSLNTIYPITNTTN